MATVAGLTRIRLKASSADPQSEVFIIDHELNLVTRGVGSIDVELPPGLYKVKFKSPSLEGSIIREKIISLEQGGPAAVVKDGRPMFASSVPLPGTSTTHEYHRDAAAWLSKEVHVHAGVGSRIFVFVRDSEPFPKSNPGGGLTLHQVSSESTVVDFSKEGVGSEDGRFPTGPQAWRGCTVELQPSVYRLRCTSPDAVSIEQSIVASPGWETLVFIFRRAMRSGKDQPLPDLANASVLLVRPFTGYDPSQVDTQEGMRRAELARLNLVNGRTAVARADLEYLLSNKFENPMLGIYAGLLLWRAAEPDLNLLSVVTSNLEYLLPEHPDVLALRWKLNRKTNAQLSPNVLPGPPMFYSSWRTVCEASIEQTWLIPSDSIMARIAGREWSGSVWLRWTALDQEDLSHKGSENLSTLTEVTTLIGPELQEPDALTRLADRLDLDPLETQLLSVVARQFRRRKRVEPTRSATLRAPNEPTFSGMKVDISSGLGRTKFERSTNVSSDLGKTKLERSEAGVPTSIQVSETELLSTLGVPRAAAEMALFRLKGKLIAVSSKVSVRA